MCDPRPDPDPDLAEVRRSKLIGRLIIVGFGLLLLIYFVPLAWSRLHHGL